MKRGDQQVGPCVRACMHVLCMHACVCTCMCTRACTGLSFAPVSVHQSNSTDYDLLVSAPACRKMAIVLSGLGVLQTFLFETSCPSAHLHVAASCSPVHAKCCKDALLPQHGSWDMGKDRAWVWRPSFDFPSTAAELWYNQTWLWPADHPPWSDPRQIV